MVYRLPAGKSLVYPGSHCPVCNHPIRWYDNVPVLGWLLLGGRCRDCHTPISVRYPIVEALTGGLFAVLGIAELFAPGTEVPMEAAIGVYLYHLVLLCTLLAAALIERDGNRVPWRLGIFAAAVGGLALLVWPQLHPLTVYAPGHGRWSQPWDILAGILAGLLVGLAAWRPRISRGPVTHVSPTRCTATLTMPAAPIGTLMIPLLVGLFLGWQAVLVLAVITSAVYLATTLALRCVTREGPRIAWSSWWVVTTLAWILSWPWLMEWVPWLTGKTM